MLSFSFLNIFYIYCNKRAFETVTKSIFISDLLISIILQCPYSIIKFVGSACCLTCAKPSPHITILETPLSSSCLFLKYFFLSFISCLWSQGPSLSPFQNSPAGSLLSLHQAPTPHLRPSAPKFILMLGWQKGCLIFLSKYRVFFSHKLMP